MWNDKVLVVPTSVAQLEYEARAAVVKGVEMEKFDTECFRISLSIDWETRARFSAGMR